MTAPGQENCEYLTDEFHGTMRQPKLQPDPM